VAGRAHRAIGREFSVGREALKRHLDNDLPRKLARAAEAEAAADADELLASLQALQRTAEAIVAKALGRNVAGDDPAPGLDFADVEAPERAHVALRAIREARAGLDLLARLEEELPGDQGQVLVVYENDWNPDG
jgi:hypothetical protein